MYTERGVQAGIDYAKRRFDSTTRKPSPITGSIWSFIDWSLQGLWANEKLRSRMTPNRIYYLRIVDMRKISRNMGYQSNRGWKDTRNARCDFETKKASILRKMWWLCIEDNSRINERERTILGDLPQYSVGETLTLSTMHRRRARLIPQQLRDKPQKLMKRTVGKQFLMILE